MINATMETGWWHKIISESHRKGGPKWQHWHILSGFLRKRLSHPNKNWGKDVNREQQVQEL